MILVLQIVVVLVTVAVAVVSLDSDSVRRYYFVVGLLVVSGIFSIILALFQHRADLEKDEELELALTEIDELQDQILEETKRGAKKFDRVLVTIQTRISADHKLFESYVQKLADYTSSDDADPNIIVAGERSVFGLGFSEAHNHSIPFPEGAIGINLPGPNGESVLGKVRWYQPAFVPSPRESVIYHLVSGLSLSLTVYLKGTAVSEKEPVIAPGIAVTIPENRDLYLHGGSALSADGGVSLSYTYLNPTERSGIQQANPRAFAISSFDINPDGIHFVRSPDLLTIEDLRGARGYLSITTPGFGEVSDEDFLSLIRDVRFGHIRFEFDGTMRILGEESFQYGEKNGRTYVSFRFPEDF